jgi:hypothetical protein
MIRSKLVELQQWWGFYRPITTNLGKAVEFSLNALFLNGGSWRSTDYEKPIKTINTVYFLACCCRAMLFITRKNFLHYD